MITIYLATLIAIAFTKPISDLMRYLISLNLSRGEKLTILAFSFLFLTFLLGVIGAIVNN